MLRVLVLIAAGARVAGAGPTRVEMRASDGAVSLGCQDERQEAATIALELRSDHGLAIAATGTRHERRAIEHRWVEGDIGHDDCYEEGAAIEWATRWTGRWESTSADAMTLDLTVTNDTCKRTLQPSTSTSDAAPCMSASKHTRMTCTRELVGIDGPEFPAGQRPIWRCTARGLGASPVRWVFGTTGCVQASGIGDHRAERIEDCARRAR